MAKTQGGKDFYWTPELSAEVKAEWSKGIPYDDGAQAAQAYFAACDLILSRHGIVLIDDSPSDKAQA